MTPAPGPRDFQVAGERKREREAPTTDWKHLQVTEKKLTPSRRQWAQRIIFHRSAGGLRGERDRDKTNLVRTLLALLVLGPNPAPQPCFRLDEGGNKKKV